MLLVVTWSKAVNLDDVKLIKNTFKVTVNDVLVSALTAAFRFASIVLSFDVITAFITSVANRRSYLEETDQLMEKDLLSAIPGSAPP